MDKEKGEVQALLYYVNKYICFWQTYINDNQYTWGFIFKKGKICALYTFLIKHCCSMRIFKYLISVQDWIFGDLFMRKWWFKSAILTSWSWISQYSIKNVENGPIFWINIWLTNKKTADKNFVLAIEHFPHQKICVALLLSEGQSSAI